VIARRPFLYVVRERDAGCNIFPLQAARLGGVAMPARPAGGTWPRETSWRDLVRRLAKNLVKN
jgi:hypothetical protein